MEFSIIGCGDRGTIYGDLLIEQGHTIKAIVEPNVDRRKAVSERYHVEKSMIFDNSDDFFKQGKLGDALIISSLDRNHYEQCMKALDTGYDILLEKPISPNPKECLSIEKKANELGKIITVGHVLRYTEFFRTLKDIIDSGELGRVIDIQHNENIGNFHMAHSFVRGNWRNSDETSPLIMQKSCHDMDILTWLVNSECSEVCSYGDLSFFKEENAPKGSSMRCKDCGVKDTCIYNAYEAYMPCRGTWPSYVLTTDQSEEGLRKAIDEGPYGRCVFHCDNNVCDHQVTILKFKNNVTATFNLSAFTNKCFRSIKVMCEKGEIRGADYLNELEVTKFASNNFAGYEQRVIKLPRTSSGHGGGDSGIIRDFLALMKDRSSENKTSITKSVESHVMAYAAELSRTTGENIKIDDLKSKLRSIL